MHNFNIAQHLHYAFPTGVSSNRDITRISACNNVLKPNIEEILLCQVAQKLSAKLLQFYETYIC